MKQARPAAAVITAGILWGMIGFFVRALSGAGLDALQIALVRLAVAAPLFTAAVAAVRPGALRIRLRDIWMFLGMGVVSIVLFNLFYFYTMVHAQASVAVVLLYTSPVFIMLLSAVLFRERITVRKVTALVMTVAGCACVAGLDGTGLTPLTLATGLASGLFYGLYTIFGRYALDRYAPLTVTVYAFLCGLGGSLAVGRPVQAVQLFAAQPSLLLWAAGIGMLCTVLPYFLYTWGLSRMESGKAAILVAVEPLVGAVIGMTCFRESHGIVKLLGIALILTALLLLSLEPQETA